MANPGPFPPMGPPMGGPMQPMNGPPMGGPGPMGPGGPRPAMLPRPPVRQGTSKMVPVVVSAGLAIGVFCGLLFGLGTKRATAAEPPKTADTKVAAADPSAGSGAPTPAPTPSTPPPAATPPPAEPAAPAKELTKLVVEIKPDEAAAVAKVYVDGAELSGTTTDIETGAGTKKVKVAVKATGFKDGEQEVDLEGESVTLKFDLPKGRSAPAAPATPAAGNTGNGGNAGSPAAQPATPTTPKAPPRPPAAKPPKKQGGGLIDI